MKNDIFEFLDDHALSLKKISDDLTIKAKKAREKENIQDGEKQVLRAISHARKALNDIIFEISSASIYSKVYPDVCIASEKYLEDTKSIAEELYGWEFIEGKLVIVIPLLPTSNTKYYDDEDRIKYKTSVDKAYLNTIDETVNEIICSDRQDIQAFIHSKADKRLIFAFNYGNDIDNKVISDSTNHYTEKIQNIIMNHFHGADGGRFGAMLVNTTQANAKTGTYIMVVKKSDMHNGFNEEEYVNTAALSLGINLSNDL